MTKSGTLAVMWLALVLPACGSGPGTSTGVSGGASASSGGSTGHGGSPATGGHGGVSGPGGTAGVQGAAGHGGTAGGRGGAGGSNVIDAGIPTDAKSCTPVNANFDCPEHFACDSQLHVCTNRCSATQPCHGGCCASGLCQSGLDDRACGQDGTACVSCNALDPGPKCVMATTVDSPTRPGGYCGCASVSVVTPRSRSALR